MLLVCAGPDTYRAVERAKELERHFRDKYDPSSTSIERLSDGKAAAAEVLSRAEAVSLFQPRRFLRADGLLSSCPKTMRDALIHVLSRDPERIIVVTVEEKPLTEEWKKLVEEIPSSHVYAYPLLTGRTFFEWLFGEAKRLGINESTKVQDLAQRTDGDGWYAMSELQKTAVFAGQERLQQIEPMMDTFQLADGLLRDDVNAKKSVLRDGIDEGMLSLTGGQARASLRVAGGATQGLHPFIIKKLRGKAVVQSQKILSRILSSIMSKRSGWSKDGESEIELI